ncbi:hypothetical protein H6775_00495 [Candidatus Nomurabacteria bacterium]|nr:hypothetical protein [Candidatus Nomurabacteria bacterium]
MKKEIKTEKAPAPVGPYSQAIEINGMVFCSGQIALDPVSGNIRGDNAVSQFEVVIQNLINVLESTGATLNDVVRVEIYLKDLSDFSEINNSYEKFFVDRPFPSRVTVEVNRLPKDALVEVSCIAVKK